LGPLSPCINHSDVNKDLTFKAKDKTLKAKDQTSKDKDQTPKDKAKDQDKDLVNYNQYAVKLKKIMSEQNFWSLRSP